MKTKSYTIHCLSPCPVRLYPYYLSLSSMEEDLRATPTQPVFNCYYTTRFCPDSSSTFNALNAVICSPVTDDELSASVTVTNAIKRYKEYPDIKNKILKVRKKETRINTT